MPSKSEIRSRRPNLEHVRPEDEQDILAMFTRLGFNDQLEVTDEEGTYFIHKENYARKNGANQNGNGRIKR